jgi:hypothetical protein
MWFRISAGILYAGIQALPEAEPPASTEDR